MQELDELLRKVEMKDGIPAPAERVAIEEARSESRSYAARHDRIERALQEWEAEIDKWEQYLADPADTPCPYVVGEAEEDEEAEAEEEAPGPSSSGKRRRTR